MPSVIERLEGTSIRLREKMSRIPPSLQRTKPEGKWSMLEHIGHLVDLESLWQGRLDDILCGRKELRPADLTNTRTEQAGHNEKLLKDLVDDFDRVRNVTIERLNSLEEARIFRAALHPRLKTPMRTIDLFVFVAEHDDHHLAKITEVWRSLRSH